MSLGDRPTPELVLLLFSAAVSVLVVLVGVGIIIVELVYPEADTESAIQTIGTTVTVMTGAVIGYLAGRRGPRRPEDEP